MFRQLALHIDHNRQRQTHICRKLEVMGFEPHKVPTMLAAKELTNQYRYSLFLVDFDTVGREAFAFCSLVRAANSQAVIMVLMDAVKIGIEERLFDCGANDVVVGKQASARVLTKRIQVHLNSNKIELIDIDTVRLRDTIIDFKRREVWRNGTTRQLPGLLADLLKYFLENPNRVISREELMKSPIWADSICSAANEGGKTFDVSVGKLRKIIELDSSHPKIITSMRGVGWKLILDAF